MCLHCSEFPIFVTVPRERFVLVSRLSILSAVLFALLLGACQTTRPGSTDEASAALRQRIQQLEAENDSLSRAADLRNPLLNSTLWVQTAVEYAGTARQAYALAEVMMTRALRDSAWTASLEQAEAGPASYRTKPPAVVLDVDETVLDNGPYQARLILDDESYGSESWAAWVQEEKAEPVPGALAFTKMAAEKGVQVIYLTNRDSELEAATRDNLEALGFPVDDAPDAVLTQGENEGWESKSPRREWVAERYRILLLVGDNFGDFASEVDTNVSARHQRSREYQQYWGSRWIVLPNPQYGSWEGALYDCDYGLSPLRLLKEKHEHLQPKRPE